MRLDRYISQTRIIELESTDFKGALQELLEVVNLRLRNKLNKGAIIKELLEREDTITTCLGNGIAMPHLRVPMNRPYIVAVGLARNGLEYHDRDEYREVRLVFLLIAGEKESNYLNFLASLARIFSEEQIIANIAASPDLATLRQRVMSGFGGVKARPERRQHRSNRLFLKQAEAIAKASRASAILLFIDTFVGELDVTEAFPRFRLILVTRAASKRSTENRRIDSVIEVRAHSGQRLSQARSAVLIGLTRGLFGPTDRLCCVGGLHASNQLDTVVVMDLEREFKNLISRDDGLLPPEVKIEVVERVLAIATELSVEGREGHPVGCLFVVGDAKRVNTMVKPLVLNPFYGYRDEDRNVLNPFMDETIKEFAVIDGCFVIRGDGVIDSAGSLLHAPSEFYEEMPSGLGSRHAVAAAISRAAECVSIAVSASTGQVTMFRKGAMLPLLDNPIG